MISLPQLLLRTLQSLYSRCSNSLKGLLFLFRSLWRLLLRRQLSRKPVPPGRPQLGSIRFEKKRLDESPDPEIINAPIVCASLQPAAEYPSANGVYGSETPERPLSYHGSLLSPPNTQNTSQSSVNLGSISRDSFSINNGSVISHSSTTSTHPHPRTRALGPSPSWRNLHRNLRARSHSPVPSVRVEDPDGNVDVPTPSDHSSDTHTMFPMAPHWIRVERYSRGVVISRDESEYVLPSVTMAFEDRGEVPGWIPFTHPEGSLFWYHEEEKVLTDAHLYEENVLKDIMIFVTMLSETLVQNGITRDDDVQTVLERQEFSEGSPVECGYYFVDHRQRCLFWHEDFDISFILQEVKGATSLSHIKLEIEAQYWSHWELFPNVQTVQQSMVDELKDIILYYTIDDQTSDTSTTPYSEEILSKMLDMVHRIRPSTNSEKKNGYAAFVVGNLMNTFYHNKFLNFHGQNGARLSREQTIHEATDHKSSLLMAILSPLLFYAPVAHFKSLEKMYVDGIVTKIPWRRFIDRLNEEWTEFTLYGTVILNANVAFLSIQSVDSSSKGSRSAAQIASYLSLVTSSAAVILGLLLVRQSRAKCLDSVELAAVYLDRMYHKDRGLAFLAIIYSLPYAMLMWSTVSFLAAFSLMCLLHTDKMTVAWVGVAWFLVVVLIFVCIFMAWESGEQFLLHWLWRKSMELGGLMTILKKNADSDRPLGSIRQWWRWCFSREPSIIPTTLTNNSIPLQVR